VPLVIIAPGAKGNGKTSPRIVEFVDLLRQTGDSLPSADGNGALNAVPFAALGNVKSTKTHLANDPNSLRLPWKLNRSQHRIRASSSTAVRTRIVTKRVGAGKIDAARRQPCRQMGPAQTIRYEGGDLREQRQGESGPRHRTI
jgi:hypothetical protein